jgi:hypothetical protein
LAATNKCLAHSNKSGTAQQRLRRGTANDAHRDEGGCVSACAMVWMSGTTRQVDPKSRVGFHGAYTVDGKGRVVGGASSGNALTGS